MSPVGKEKQCWPQAKRSDDVEFQQNASVQNHAAKHDARDPEKESLDD